MTALGTTTINNNQSDQLKDQHGEQQQTQQEENMSNNNSNNTNKTKSKHGVFFHCNYHLTVSCIHKDGEPPCADPKSANQPPHHHDDRRACDHLASNTSTKSGSFRSGSLHTIPTIECRMLWMHGYPQNENISHISHLGHISHIGHQDSMP